MNEEFILEDIDGINHFYWVGGETLYTDPGRTAKLQQMHSYDWGMRTPWRFPIMQGKNQGNKQYRKIYGFFLPSNSPDLRTDIDVVVGGWTFCQGRKINPWGVEREKVSAEHKYGQLQTYYNGEKTGDFYVATEKLGVLEPDLQLKGPSVSSLPKPKPPFINKAEIPWRVFGGYRDVRNNSSKIDTKILTNKWGLAEGDQQIEIAAARTFWDNSKKYQDAYGRAVLTLGYR
ncbi:hypothetical protein ACVFI8_21600 [Agarivorans sp. MS3-6]